VTDIPDDVLKAAIVCWNSRVGHGPVVEDIALAILAERNRCASAARKEAKIYDTPHGSQPAYLAAYMIAERIESGQ